MVYGDNDHVIRRQLWKSLEENKLDVVPWLNAGDMNIIRSELQSLGGGCPPQNAMNDFNQCIEELDVTELASQECEFTWTVNWQNQECCMRKPDHVLCNESWFQKWTIF
ncbi:hypothetical protein LIER_35999 [Lithospermum erythrorhizon]|uniref:Uncharacterized protein n=1 Tax=Lithospermum erythrorhizon TaxID=34254 RepID=A0AAV3P3D5_LITER